VYFSLFFILSFILSVQRHPIAVGISVLIDWLIEH